MIIGGALNVFRLLGDMLHLASFLIMFHKLYKAKSVEGISRKTQELYLLVFVTRYLDVFFAVYHAHSYFSILLIYNTLMKLFFIGSSASIIYRFHKLPWKATYNEAEDSFLHWIFLVLPCFVIACLINLYNITDFMEVLYSFSIVLEAVTIFPQLVMLQRHKNVENLTANFVAALGKF